MMHIEHFTFNIFLERTIIVWDENGFCAFVDPGFSSDREKDKLVSFVTEKGLKPACIMLTHGHFDHVAGVAELVELYGIPVYMHTEEKYTLDVTNPVLGRAFGLSEPKAFDYTHASGTIEVGSLKFEVIETPGHSKGSVCFLERNEKVLFSGDTLFAGAIGRTDHPGGDYDMLMKSIFEKLMCLDGDITVIPGHGPETSIADERMTNPFLLPFNEPYNE